MQVAPLVGKQLVSVQHATARICIWEGAVRSSKTICSLLKWLEFIRKGPPGALLMVGKTERTLIRNLLDPLVEMIGPKRCRIVSGSGEAWILGRKVYLVGANDERAQEKIRGLTLAGAYADELSTLPESFWSMLLTRLSVPGAQVFASSNPDGPKHWLKVNYLDRASLHITGAGEIIRSADPSCLNLHRFSFKLADNPSLTSEYVDAVSREFTGLWHRRLILGEWCLAQGVVYDMYDEVRHVIRGALPPMIRLPGVGIDYGTANPFAALMLGLQRGDRETKQPARLVLAREFRHDSRAALAQKTDAELSRDLRTWLGTDRPEWIVVDPSAASFKVQLFRDGVGRVVDARNDVLAGIRMVASLLATNQLVIHDSCAGLLSELQSYSWDPKAALLGEDRPIKKDDHSLDAARYVIATTETLWRPLVPASYALAA